MPGTHTHTRRPHIQAHTHTGCSTRAGNQGGQRTGARYGSTSLGLTRPTSVPKFVVFRPELIIQDSTCVSRTFVRSALAVIGLLCRHDGPGAVCWHQTHTPTHHTHTSRMTRRCEQEGGRDRTSSSAVAFLLDFTLSSAVRRVRFLIMPGSLSSSRNRDTGISGASAPSSSSAAALHTDTHIHTGINRCTHTRKPQASTDAHTAASKGE